MEIFKKGQMVTKRLNLVDVTNSKHRRNIVFGEDVLVDGKTIKVLGKGPAIHIKKDYIKRRKNGPNELIYCSISCVNALSGYF